MSSHLKLRGTRYSFRMRVPGDCRAQLGVEITRDLGTAVKRDADRIARQLAVDYKGLFAAIRACVALGQSFHDAKALARQIGDRRLTGLQEPSEAPLLDEPSPPALPPIKSRLQTSVQPEVAIPTPTRHQEAKASAKTLDVVLESLLAEKTAKGQWRSGTKQPAYRTAERFVEFIGGTRAVAEVDRADVLRWLGSRRTTVGQPLAPTTHNNEAAAVNMLFGHAQLNRWITWNPAQGLRQVDPRANHERRDAFTLAELQRLFGAEFIAWADHSRLGKQWPARRFVPLLMVGAGMRLKEAAQLAIEDVYERAQDGLWVARVTHDLEEQGRRNGRRTAKNRSSRREVPLHPLIHGLGFLDFVLKRKRESSSPSEPLFPEMIGKHAVAMLSISANRILLPKVGIKRPSTAIYSLRHSFTTAMEHEGVPLLSAKQLVGHTLGSDAHSAYVKPREVKQLAAEAFPALDRWLPQVFKNVPTAG